MSWTNQTKNTATLTNQTKNSATFSNLAKGVYGFLLKLNGGYLLKQDGGKLILTNSQPTWSNLTKN